jgi:hypothetical protein
MAMPSKPRELPSGRGAAQIGVVGRHHAGHRHLAAQHAATGIGLHQEGAELLAEPVVAVVVHPHGLDVQIGAGQPVPGPDARIHRDAGLAGPAAGVGIGLQLVDLGEAQAAQRVGQRDVAAGAEAGQTPAAVHIHRAHGAGAGHAAAVPAPEIRLHGVDPQHRIRRIGLGAEAVVRHDAEGARARSRQHGREALHRLLIHQRQRAAIGRADELARGGAGREGVGRQAGKADQFGGLGRAGAAQGSQRGQGHGAQRRRNT